MSVGRAAVDLFAVGSVDHSEGELGTLQAFTRPPGIVLRCPGCENIILRVVETLDGFYLDFRRAAHLHLKHVSAA